MSYYPAEKKPAKVNANGFKKPQQQELLEMVLRGVSVRAGAKTLGLSLSTAYRWASETNFQDAYRKRVTSQMSAMLPNALAAMESKLQDSRSGLLPITKAAEFLADRVGVAPIIQEETKPALAIQINLDTGAEPEKVIDPEKEQMRAELDALKEQMAEMKRASN